MMQSIEEYMESRRRDIDRYVEGEHKWLGDVDASTLTDSLSMYPGTIPWYHSREG